MKFYLNKKKIISKLINEQDTTNDFKITIEDTGDKTLELKNDNGKIIAFKGTYQLSNILQEAALIDGEEGYITINNIEEEPVHRIVRLIKTIFWEKLSRAIDIEGLLNIIEDSKRDSKGIFYVYVPSLDTLSLKYYKNLLSDYSNIHLIEIPEKLEPNFLKSLIQKPGILSLSVSLETNQPEPFIVPGGRFNEMYGWDSYFISEGLLLSDYSKLTFSIINNLSYQIKYYGKILNANRSYYITRSQPPLFTSLLRLFLNKFNKSVSKKWIKSKVEIAILEYNNVWMKKGVRHTETELNRYFGEGTGVPLETEEEHFKDIFLSVSNTLKISREQLEKSYKSGTIVNKELDEYFIHDRSMRESGHDTTTRLDNISADLNTVDLNSFLYKYETDIAFLISEYLDDKCLIDEKIVTSQNWLNYAKKRQLKINELLWDNTDKLYYDYNFKTKRAQKFNSLTNFFPLWAKLASESQAKHLIENHLPNFIEKGGLVSTLKFKKEEDITTSERQWDYPYGWAPHQMLIWDGLNNYGYKDILDEVIYRWLWLITKTSVEYNGTIPEKFDVVNSTHKTNVEYGNVGTSFKYLPDGGFGWTNASYLKGIEMLDKKYISHLNNLTDPNNLF